MDGQIRAVEAGWPVGEGLSRVRKRHFDNILPQRDASFGGNVLSFNVRSLGKRFFDPPVSAGVIDLIVHEIGHHAGMHTEKAYHESLTKLAGDLVMTALKDPAFFEV